MKKLLLVLSLLSFVLVGCVDQSEIYTKDQVDQMLKDQRDDMNDMWAALNARYIQMENGDDNLYYDCTLDGMVKVCKSVNYQEQIDQLEDLIDQLEVKSLDHFQDIKALEFDLEWLAGDTIGFTEDMFLELQQIKLAIKELELMYNTMYYNDQLMTEL